MAKKTICDFCGEECSTPYWGKPNHGLQCVSAKTPEGNILQVEYAVLSVGETNSTPLELCGACVGKFLLPVANVDTPETVAILENTKENALRWYDVQAADIKNKILDIQVMACPHLENAIMVYRYYVLGEK